MSTEIDEYPFLRFQDIRGSGGGGGGGGGVSLTDTKFYKGQQLQENWPLALTFSYVGTSY